MRSRWKAAADASDASPRTSNDQSDARRHDFEIDFGTYSRQLDDDDLDIDLDFGGDSSEPRPRPRTTSNLDFGSRRGAGARGAEDDDDEESDVGTAALEAFRSELRGKLGDWYVVHTYSGMENRVLQNLENRVSSLNMEDFIYEIIVPTEEVTEIRNGQRKQVRRTVLPGYVLVRMDLTDESWSTVRHTPSVTGFVGHSNQPGAAQPRRGGEDARPGRGRRRHRRHRGPEPSARRRSRSPTSPSATRSWWSTGRSPACTPRSPRST